MSYSSFEPCRFIDIPFYCDVYRLGMMPITIRYKIMVFKFSPMTSSFFESRSPVMFYSSFESCSSFYLYTILLWNIWTRYHAHHNKKPNHDFQVLPRDQLYCKSSFSRSKLWIRGLPMISSCARALSHFESFLQAFVKA